MGLDVTLVEMDIYFYDSLFSASPFGSIRIYWLPGQSILTYIINSIVLCILIISFIFSLLWSSLYYRTYKFRVEEDRVVVERGVIGRRIANIPYERIQNANIWIGILDRIFGLSSIHIETARSACWSSSWHYGRVGFAEAQLQELKKSTAYYRFHHGKK
jgi:uncharacterized membrane protein YdbT with pleckstrin-like domain